MNLKQYVQDKVRDFRQEQREQKLIKFENKLRLHGFGLSYERTNNTIFKFTLSPLVRTSPIYFIFPKQTSVTYPKDLEKTFDYIERFLWTLTKITHIIPRCDKPVWFTINPETIIGSIVVNKQKYSLSFHFDPDDTTDVSTIEGTSPLRYDKPETNKDRPIFLDVNQSNARLMFTQPCDWSQLFITYSMDTDYVFFDFNEHDFKQFLYEFERVRSKFTNI